MSLTRVLQGLNATGVVWVFALTFLICADIIARTVFDAPIAGVTEIVSLSLVATVFLMVGYATHSGRLMRVELLVQPLAARRPALESTWQAALAVIGAALFVLIAVGMWPDFVRALRTAEFAGVEGIYKIRVWPIKLLVIVGAAAAALELLRQAVVRWRAAQSAPPESGRWLAAAAVVVIAAAVAVLLAADAAPRTVGVAMIALTLAFVVAGMPIAITLLCVGFLGLAVLRDDFTVATRTLALAAEGTISDFVFAAVPLFVLMGLFVNASDIGRDAFRAAQRVFGGLRGGLGVATVAANAVFAAITGISIAAAAIFS
jgi:TRAP-type C4-dicarboxylate transport system permease small subunit